MRLINTKSLELSEFIAGNIPPWAILSHTWEAEEISLLELNKIQKQPESERAHSIREKRGYTKIREFCGLCQKGIPICRHLNCLMTCELPESNCCLKTDQICQCEPLIVQWGWIDTCCIDKSSSAELTEAINSMYTWYKSAIVCIAYLCDVPGDDDVASESSAFRKSKWFTRGWTLQELIAPDTHGVNFYSMDWNFLGSTTFTRKLMYSPSINNSLVQQIPDIAPQSQAKLNESHIEAGLNGDQTQSESNKSHTHVPPGDRTSRRWSTFLSRLKPSRDQTEIKSKTTNVQLSGSVPAVSDMLQSGLEQHLALDGKTPLTISSLHTTTDRTLPPGWEARKNLKGRTYFVDHITQTTTWINPLDHISGTTTQINPHKREQMYMQQFWLCDIVSQITKIPQEVFGPSGVRRDCHGFSIAERMSWASSRKTTRGEDIAYCLLGLFDLNMPLLYGEGPRKAFFRLQEEIMRRSYDHTLFAWQVPDASQANQPQVGLFADHPSRFWNSKGNSKRWPSSNLYLPTNVKDMFLKMASHPYSLLNNAVQMTVPIIPSKPDVHRGCPQECCLVVLDFVYNNNPDNTVTIHLYKDRTNGIWYRSRGMDMPQYHSASDTEKYLNTARRVAGTEFAELQVCATW